MKAVWISFKMMLLQISRDGMMIMLCIAPVLVALVFKYIIPMYVEPLLPFDITEYYLLMDLMLAIMVPYMFCFSSTLVVLEEIDDNVAPYLSVTPVGKNGYLFSRLIVPTVISMFMTVLLLSFFSLIGLSFIVILTLAFTSALSVLITSMLVVSFARNKVEGMALSKVSGFMLIGLIIPFFISGNIQYLFSFLPLFWVSKFVMYNNYWFFFLAILCSFLWIAALFGVYRRKLL